MTNTDINQRIGDLQAVQNITDVYQQVAAMRMRKVRDGILNNRGFYLELADIYRETQACYLENAKTNKKLVATHRKNTNGKSISVLLSSNTGLYGSIIKNVFNKFMSETKDSKDDLVIIGQLGRNWFQALNLQKPCKFMDMSDGTEGVDAQTKQVFDYISKYTTIKIYHGIFKNIADQPVKVTTITQQPESNTKPDKTLPFLFEPSIDKVLQTFEEQLLYSFFDQSVYESALSKYGSRMLSLDTATQNIAKLLLQSKLMATKMKHQLQNKKQQESLKIWNKK